ncbi:hypothetical protein HanPI659440_Chr17g0665841 [Helianthus annuus]|nr:hypothetical protein HanHA300_Chr17g0639381 [Helianthus annuus]KAJ0446134.1 hypothetical protein HanHA89_Chr17g0691001 [Helianthus annuus]KAJ0631093.1 hypothetical protein HanLR1_Chr17g0650261 [Helianthus annuus]KAJ0666351.1 hypothetical protein HanPI659440_Chr17g0665841 [Helianthus annuus]
MKCDIPKPIRSSSFKKPDQIPNPIKINPITNTLQILQHRFKRINPKPHHRSSECGHTHIRSHIDESPGPPFSPHLVQQVLDGNRNIGSPKQFAFEHPDNVLVGFIG